MRCLVQGMFKYPATHAAVQWYDEIHVCQWSLNMAVSLRLPDDLSARLGQLSAKTGRSKTFYMIEAIREHIDDLEDLYLSEQRLIANRAGESQSIPLEDVMKRYGLEG